jgi:molybdenum cofactor cytidylyltransferase
MGKFGSEIVGLLLAAGSGRRFGGDKLLYRLPDGRPMAVAAAAGLLPACERLIAVVRPAHEALASKLADMGCHIVHAPAGDQGMGVSLAAGVRATADAGGWIVALADMPFIDSRSHLAVLSRLRAGASLAATQYAGRRGHPVGFAKQWFSQLVAMTGDQGGKAILETHPEHVVLCPVDDCGVVWDIDQPTDFSKRY